MIALQDNSTSLTAVDSETGFLFRNPDRELVNGFESVSICTPAVKLNILKTLLNTWNISKACSRAGISRWTFARHYQLDESFKQCVDEIHERHIDAADEVRHMMALAPSGSFDRMALLNAYRSEVYNPKVKIEVEHTISREEGARRIDALSHAIDVEIVDTVQKIRAQRARHAALKTQKP